MEERVFTRERYERQIADVHNSLIGHIRNMRQISDFTGIERPNVCRYISILREKGKIIETGEGLCPITQKRTKFFTADKQNFPNK